MISLSLEDEDHEDSDNLIIIPWLGGFDTKNKKKAMLLDSKWSKDLKTWPKLILRITMVLD